MYRPFFNGEWHYGNVSPRRRIFVSNLPEL
jgi:hypothetical protein